MMTKHTLFLLVCLLAITLPVSNAFAEEETAKKAEGEGGEGGKKDPKKDDKKGDTDITGGRFSGDPIYVHIAPMVLPVIDENGVEQLVTLILDVQVKNFDAADEMHTHMPKVMDSLMRSLYGGLGTGVLRRGKLVNVSKVKDKSLAAVSEVIGADKILDVLVQSVSQRML